jgi:hypothetical protein
MGKQRNGAFIRQKTERFFVQMLQIRFDKKPDRENAAGSGY